MVSRESLCEADSSQGVASDDDMSLGEIDARDLTPVSDIKPCLSHLSPTKFKPSLSPIAASSTTTRTTMESKGKQKEASSTPRSLLVRLLLDTTRAITEYAEFGSGSRHAVLPALYAGDGGWKATRGHSSQTMERI
jgi:hypothetical protein